MRVYREAFLFRVTSTAHIFWQHFSRASECRHFLKLQHGCIQDNEIKMLVKGRA
jgi:hypothetical protein